ncbi:hypothetical protein [Paraburkholderia lycopersici]|uniref:Uncharacterized protein n=1 Tax=Paraburkholderia lycopersici TaxID=416944 RepID=A0A1G6YR01_9BURK|nr:hypothetical protein [Paraburkholderia lycopersici]SDD91976.1 hypothetical protein SAMN05421548_12843 [Paraburkholderia lycopersici]
MIAALLRHTAETPTPMNDSMFPKRYRPMTKKKAIPAFLLIAPLLVLFSGNAAASEQAARPPGPAMMVHFDYYPNERPEIHALEHRLANAIRRADAGELGETEYHIDGNDGYLYMYGPDPDRLYRVTSPVLKSSRITSHSEVTKWHGSRKETFVIH